MSRVTSEINTNFLCVPPFLDSTTHHYKRSCPSVRRMVPCYFCTTKIVVFEVQKSSNDININDTSE